MQFDRALDILNYAAAGEAAPADAFLWRDGWVVRKRLLGRALLDPQNPLRHIFGLPMKRLLALALRGGTPLTLTLAADAVQLRRGGDRIRTFHHATRRTVKYVREGCKLGDLTANEAPIRFAVQKLGALPVPELFTAESRDGYMILTEAQIEARPFRARRDHALFLPQVVDPLMRFYETSGITFAPLSEALGSLTHAIVEHRLPLLELLNRNPMVATALCHNDTVQSNLAVGREGQVYFLDWGVAAPGLAGRDFLRIGHRYADPAILHGLDQRIRDLHHGALTLADMLALQEAQRQHQPF